MDDEDDRELVFFHNGEVPGNMEEKLKSIIPKVVDEQRARLNASSPYAWWADLVFAARDMNGLCNALLMMQQPEISSALAEISAATVKVFIAHFLKDDEEACMAMAKELVKDSNELDAVMQKAALQAMGSNGGTEH